VRAVQLPQGGLPGGYPAEKAMNFPLRVELSGGSEGGKLFEGKQIGLDGARRLL